MTLPTLFDEVLEFLEGQGFYLSEYKEECRSGAKCWRGKKPIFCQMGGGQNPEPVWYGCAVCAINKIAKEATREACCTVAKELREAILKTEYNQRLCTTQAIVALQRVAKVIDQLEKEAGR